MQLLQRAENVFLRYLRNVITFKRVIRATKSDEKCCEN